MLGDEVPSARIAWMGLAIGGVVLLAVAVVFGLLHAWHYPAGGDQGGAAQVATIPPPRLQTAPQDERSRHRDAEERAMRAIAIEMTASGAAR